MWNFQGIVFTWTRSYRQIFKSDFLMVNTESNWSCNVVIINNHLVISLMNLLSLLLERHLWNIRGETFRSLLVARCFLLFARYFLLVARYFLLVTFCSLLVTFCLLLFACCSLLLVVARYFLLVVCYFLLVACYFLLVAHYFLLVARQEILKDFFLSKSKQKVLHINLYKKFDLWITWKLG